MIPLIKCLRSWLLAGFFALPLISSGQATEVEPNNSCPTAQDVGTPVLPFEISGNLGPAVGVPNIDFFRFTGVPGEILRADHQGATTGAGTLNDPLLGLFDSDCNLIGFNDDAVGLDSRLVFTVPANGIYVLAATAFPDSEFLGSGEAGSYLLTVRGDLAGSISGNLVDARDGTSLPGDKPPFASVQLIRCVEDSCFEYVDFQSADRNGNFHFDFDYTGSPFFAGTYQIQAFANGFETFLTEPFEVLEGEHFVFGPIALTPPQLIGSVSGRLLNSIDGTPLSGFGPPFAYVWLERCEEFGCYYTAFAQPDEQGHFRFEGSLYFIVRGTYRVTAYAEDYQPTTTVQFDVGEFQDVDLGDIALTLLPIQFGAVHGCEIPPGGGICEYGIELRNRGPGRFKGQAWSTVYFYPNNPQLRFSQFQVGKVGATNPMPQRLNLRVGETTLLEFQLNFPRSVPDGSTICAYATVGSDPAPQFHSQGDRFLFCAVTQSGALEPLSEKEGRKRVRELKQKQLQ